MNGVFNGNAARMSLGSGLSSQRKAVAKCSEFLANIIRFSDGPFHDFQIPKVFNFLNRRQLVGKFNESGYLEIVKRAIAETDYVREKFATFRNSFPS